MARNLTCDCGSSFAVDGPVSEGSVACPVCGRKVQDAAAGGPREFVTLWVPENVVRERVQVDALSHFVAAVERVVRRQLDSSSPPDGAPPQTKTSAGPGAAASIRVGPSHDVSASSSSASTDAPQVASSEQGELDVACALLPNGRLLLDIQFFPPELAERHLEPLERQLSALRCPPVRLLPVTFSFRKRLGRTPQGLHGFNVPFLRLAGDWQGDSLDDLVLAAAARAGLWDAGSVAGAKSVGLVPRYVDPFAIRDDKANASPSLSERDARTDAGTVQEARGRNSNARTEYDASSSLSSNSGDVGPATASTSDATSSASAGESPPSPGTTIRRTSRRRRFGEWLLRLRDWLARRRSRAASADATQTAGPADEAATTENAVAKNELNGDSSADHVDDSHEAPSFDVDSHGMNSHTASGKQNARKPGNEQRNASAFGGSLNAEAPDSLSVDSESPEAPPPDSARADDFTLDQVCEFVQRYPNEARYYRWRAELYQRAGDLTAAVADYSESLKRRPGDVETLLARGAAYCVADDTRHGLADFNEVLTLHPNHVAARFNRGLVYLELDACEPAIDDFTAAIAGDPWNSKLFLSRGRARALLKQYEDALADIDSAIQLDPNADEPYVLRGALQRFVRPIPECTRQAIADFSRAIEIDPKQPLYYLQRAEHFWAVDDYEAALDDCNRALALNPELAVGLGLRGAVNVGLDRFQEAVDDCTRAMEAGHTGVQVYLSRAEAYQGLEDFDAALGDADRAVELAPHLATAWKCRSLVRARLGMTKPAIEDLSEAIRLEPDQAVLYCHRAALHRHLGRTKSALRDCDRAVRRADDFAPAYLIRAGCWEDLEQRDKAAADLDRLVELASDADELAQARAERANFWMRWDEFERARLDFDHVLQHRPDHFMALFHRGQILAALGRFDEALADMNAVIRIAPTFSPAYARRAHIWLNKENLEQADADYAEAIRLDPSAAEQLQIMRLLDEAHLRLKRHEFEDAIRLATEAIETAEEAAPAYHVRANAYWYSEQYVEAVADFDKLLELVDDPSTVYAGRGQVLAELGEFEDAVRDLDRALEANSERQTPRHRAYALSGRALAHAGRDDFAAAERDFGESVAAAPGNAWVYYNQGRVYLQQSNRHAAEICFRLALQTDDPPLTPRQRAKAERLVGGPSVAPSS